LKINNPKYNIYILYKIYNTLKMFRLCVLILLVNQIYSFGNLKKNISITFLKNTFNPNNYISNSDDNDKLISNHDYIFEPTDYELSQLELLDKILPLTPNQISYNNILNDNTTPIIVVNGPTGTGKTLFAVSKAFNDLKDELIEKIIIINPLMTINYNITNNIIDTLLEYCSGFEIDYMIMEQKIQFESFQSIRGMTFKNTFIICEDMQYSTIDDMLLLLTRLGVNSRIVINGDTNINNKFLENGLSDLINKIQNKTDLDFIKYIQMTINDIQRHHYIKNILKAYN